MANRIILYLQVVKRHIFSLCKNFSNFIMWPLHNWRSCLYCIGVVVGVSFLLMTVRDFRSGRLIVCDIPTPQSLEEKGYSSRVMADKIIYNIKLGGSQSSNLFPKQGLSDISIKPVIMTLRSDAESFTVYGNSYNLILSALSKLLHIPIPTVRGNIVETTKNSYLLTFSIDGESVYRLPFTASGTENVIKKAGFKICSKVFPYELAISYYETQHYLDCISILEGYSPTDTIQTGAKLVLQGAAKLHLGEYNEALKAFMNAYEMKNEAFILHNIASVRLQQRLYQDAIELEKVLIKSKNETESGHIIAGHAYSKLLDLNNAEKHFRRALEINPKCAEAYFQWGIMLWLRNNNLEGAIDKYRQCLEADPFHYQATVNLACTYATLGDTKEADFYSKKAISIIRDKNLNVNFERKGDTVLIGGR